MLVRKPVLFMTASMRLTSLARLFWQRSVPTWTVPGLGLTRPRERTPVGGSGPAQGEGDTMILGTAHTQSTEYSDTLVLCQESKINYHHVCVREALKKKVFSDITSGPITGDGQHAASAQQPGLQASLPGRLSLALPEWWASEWPAAASLHCEVCIVKPYHQTLTPKIPCSMNTS